MLRVGTGQSSNSSTAQAVEEAAGQAMTSAGLSQADFVLVFFTVDHVPNRQELITGLRQISRTDRIIGCSGVGVLTEEGEIEGKPGIAVLVLSSDRIKTYPFLFHPLRERDREVGDELAQTIRGKSEQDSLLALFVDAYNGSPGTILQEVGEHLGFLPVVGAGCSENGSQGKTYQLLQEQFTSNALSGLFLTGSFNSSIGVTQGCQPVSEPMVITKAQENL
ncbi:MAG: FIST N-terminal domain-containing protein, partial [Candidatus Binatia bacterium]